MTSKQACLGCHLANKKEPAHVVYENELITCILDIEQFNEGHLLILPKNHFMDVDELDEPTANAVMVASKKLAKAIKQAYAPDGISICQNGGLFNDLGHYHMHLIPRFQGQPFYHEEDLDNGKAKRRLAASSLQLRKYL